MKSALFFVLFFINSLVGFYFRNPIAFGFSIIALLVSILFAFRTNIEEKEEEVSEAKE